MRQSHEAHIAKFITRRVLYVTLHSKKFWSFIKKLKKSNDEGLSYYE